MAYLPSRRPRRCHCTRYYLQGDIKWLHVEDVANTLGTTSDHVLHLCRTMCAGTKGGQLRYRLYDGDAICEHVTRPSTSPGTIRDQTLEVTTQNAAAQGLTIWMAPKYKWEAGEMSPHLVRNRKPIG